MMHHFSRPCGATENDVQKTSCGSSARFFSQRAVSCMRFYGKGAYYERVSQRRGADRQHPAAGGPAVCEKARSARDDPREAGGHEPRRQRQGPRRTGDDPARRGRGQAPSRLRHHRADQRQHRHRPCVGRPCARLPRHPHHAGQHESGAAQPARRLRRGAGAHARGAGNAGRGGKGRSARRRNSRQLRARPVHEPAQS